MNSDLSLAIAGVLFQFLLRSTLAYSVCVLLSRLITRASHRFIVWAGFLYGSAAYWLYLASTLIPAKHSASGSPLTFSSPTRTVAPSLTIPESWAFSLSLMLGLLGVIYGVALVYNIISHARKLANLRWVMGFATEPPAEITGFLQALSKGLQRRPPRLMMLSGASSPATFGWLRPIIVLPTVCIEQDHPDLEDILLHELHHVRRRDSLWNALGIAARAVLCFHPAAWHAMRAMQFDCELACDLAVITRDPERKGMYAESLLRFARLNLAQEPATWGIDFAASPEHLTVRIHSILAVARESSRWWSWLRTGVSFALVAAFAGVVPSLAILLGYTHPQSTIVSTITTPRSIGVKASRTVKRSRALAAQITTPTAQGLPARGDTLQASAQSDVIAATEAQASPDTSSGPGPHLQRRRSGSGTNSGTKSQSIGLIDESESGQTGNHADRSQTVQQSATVAAAIWKRVGDLDRH